MAQAKSERKRLSDLLVEIAIVDRSQMQRALAHQRQSGMRLLRALVELNLVDEDRLVRALSGALGVEAVTPATMRIHERVLNLVPARLAHSYGALPIAIKRANQADYLYVAMADPLDKDAADDLERVTGCRLSVLIAPPSQLDAALEHYYAAAIPEAPLHVPPSHASTSSLERAMSPERSTSTEQRRSARSVPPPPPMPSPPAQPKASPPVLPAARPARGAAPPPKPMPSPPPSPDPRAKSRPIASPPPPAQPMVTEPGTRRVSPRPPDITDPSGFSSSRPPQADKRAAPPPLTAPRAVGPITLPPELSAQDLGKTQLDTRFLEIGSAPPPAIHGRHEAAPIPIAPLEWSEKPSRPEPSSKPSPAPERESKRAFQTLTDADAERAEAATKEIAWVEEGKTLDASEAQIQRLLEDEQEVAREAGRVPALLVSEPPDEHIVTGEIEQPVDEVEVAAAPQKRPTPEPPRKSKPRSSPPERDPDADLNLIEADSEDFAPVVVSEPPPAPAPRARVSFAPDPLVAPPPLPAAAPPIMNRGDALAAPAAMPNVPPAFVNALEVPVDAGFAPSPFDSLRNVSMRAGLEKTGIIPLVDFERDEFVPPPPERPRRDEDRHLVGTDDIPLSKEAAKARASGSFEPARSEPPPRPAAKVSDVPLDPERAARAERIERFIERALERTDPGRGEPAKAEPPEVARPEPARSDPARLDAGRPESGRPDQPRAEQPRFEAMPLDGLRPEHARVEVAPPSRSTPERAAPERSAPERSAPERSTPEPVRSEPPPRADALPPFKFESPRLEVVRSADVPKPDLKGPRGGGSLPPPRRVPSVEAPAVEPRSVRAVLPSTPPPPLSPAPDAGPAYAERSERARIPSPPSTPRMSSQPPEGGDDDQRPALVLSDRPSDLIRWATDKTTRAPIATARRMEDEPPTNPRINADAVQAALLEPEPTPTPGSDGVSRDLLIAELADAVELPELGPPSLDPEPIVEPVRRSAAPAEPEPLELSPELDEQRELVSALLDGRSLSSADRAQLVLAIGRLLIEKGLIGKEELARALAGRS